MKKYLKSIIFSPLIIFFCCSYTNHNKLEITICSFEKTLENSNNPLYFGHSFILLKNNFGFPIELGYYQVNPNETASFGLWSGVDNQSFITSSSNAFLSDYPGIYKDRECYVLNYEQMLDCYQYTITVDRVTFLTSGINDYMKSVNDHYDGLGFNCTCFAIDFFKYASGKNLYDNIFGTSTPGGLKQSMKKEYGNDVIENNNIIYKAKFYKYISKTSTLMSFTKKG